MKYSNIRVLVARSVEAVDNHSCDDVRECDTVKEAKAFARYSLTPEYSANRTELACGRIDYEQMNYARVMVEEDGKEFCLVDYFRKGWNPAETETAQNELHD